MGCVADVETGATPDSKEQSIFQFSPSVFKFVVTVPDDHTDVAGGTQTARAVLRFPAVRPGLTCNVKVDVAIRSATEGIIPPQRAAQVTAEIATVSASVTYHLREDWPSALFCAQWREGMQRIFEGQYCGFGARVSPW
jgi:hypothetical protein